MKRIAIYLVVSALVAGGCLTPSLPTETESKKPATESPAPVVAPPTPPPIVVQPDQVNEGNARQKAQELSRELDQAALQPAPQAAPVSMRPAVTIRP